MKSQPSSKTSRPHASLKSARTPDARSTVPDTKATPRMTQQRAESTLVSLGLQSPRRPTTEPQSDELLTRQRRDEEALLLAIEGAMTRNEDASAEGLLLQLKELQQQGAALQQSLASKHGARIESWGRAEQLRAYRSKIEEELEAARVLTEELQAAKEFVQALEARIEASAARAESLAKELDALPKTPAFENVVKRNVVGGDVTQAMRYQESSAVGMSLAVAVTHQQNSLQRLIDQEKKVDSTKKSHFATSPRSNARPAKEKSHRDIQKIKDQRQTIDLSSVKFANPVERDDSHIVPVPPLPPEQKRATLPTFGEWGGTPRGPSRQKGWQTSVRSPRESTQLATPRLGVVRKEVVSAAIADLRHSVADATDRQIADALEKLQRIEGSHQNLDAAIQECLEKAAAARSKSQGLERQAAEMEAQAATLQKVNEGRAPKSQETIAALQAELARRASRQVQDADAESIEYGTVERAEKRAFEETTFTQASFSLDDVLAQLGDLASTSEPEHGRQKPHVDDKKQIAARPLGRTAGVSEAQSSNAARKLDEHSAKYRQLKLYAAQEKTAVRKWRAEVARQKVDGSQKPTGEVFGMNSPSNM
ncbi:hypothetical protein [Rhizobacter sp. SG703]|uniref:hypothetical protein n=1 Tax=Rhizobacter sp. SG703 TaxID=2587140 RepID=UPI0014455BD2|nr:hypothetical protein [Rhizobacter sp. SG703]NKI95820.1 hypothetical protein [Rhizobacter sp. SG703]